MERWPRKLEHFASSFSLSIILILDLASSEINSREIWELLIELSSARLQEYCISDDTPLKFYHLFCSGFLLVHPIPMLSLEMQSHPE